ncbi:protein-L-isoaspartate(D-aspartate) O-methyltransferase [Candidatus Pacearchaeota archaeon]|nr:MAG: protein-L-isoaspartate(D-aspartate) O-methyltransferase [Candidatus Pacearchaeota archaeon]
MGIEELLRFWKENEIVHDERIIEAFLKVKREDFLPEEQKPYAYVDSALKLFCGQTISQPTTVAIMTKLLKPNKDQKILEIGSGSGYQAAILGHLVQPKGKVFTIEIIKELFEFAKKNLEHFENVEVIFGDGSVGYKKEAPYDRIIITAASPRETVEGIFPQLRLGGILVAPVDYGDYQKMYRFSKLESGEIEEEEFGDFVFVPLRGKLGFAKFKTSP